MTSVPALSTPPSGQTHPDDQPGEPASASRAPGISKKPTSGKRAPNSQHSKRPTHFVCFPLVTEESVAQLSKSLAYFRSITTPLPLADRDVTPGRDHGHQTYPESTAPELSSSEIRSQYVDEALRVIPEPAHRPPGTFHLTLGVMHLPNAEDLENAAALLQSIDYLELLRRAEAGEGDGAQQSAREKGTQQVSRGGASEVANEVIPSQETQSVKADNPSAATEKRYQSNEAQHDAGADRRQADPQELQRTKTPHLLPDTSRHKPGEKGTLHQAAEEAEATLSSPAQTLTSLSREISPPRVSARLPQDDDSQGHALPQPITISLTSLGTFPSAGSARVFYAHPHDPTSRLHRFGNLVRDVFREAGLITETRPLVLHATVANMVYVRGKGGRGKGRRWRGKGRGGEDGSVDAREILRLFNPGSDAYARPRPAGAASSSQSSVRAGTGESDHNNRDGESAAAATTSSTTTTTTTTTTPDTPFTWARDITLCRIRICKMGAEPSPLPGWGLEYRPVAEQVFLPELRASAGGERAG